MTEPSNEVRDEAAGSRFVIATDGIDAELQYRKRGDRLILIHTEVPDALGGHGVGGQLVRAAIAAARAEQLTIVPWCPFARKWLRDHTDETDGINIDWKTLPPTTTMAKVER